MLLHCLFCCLLDARKGGALTISPDGLVGSRQRYEPDTGVLITELDPQDLPTYARLLVDVLEEGRLRPFDPWRRGRGGMRIVEPVLAAWREERVPLHDYEAGGVGPVGEAHR